MIDSLLTFFYTIIGLGALLGVLVVTFAYIEKNFNTKNQKNEWKD